MRLPERGLSPEQIFATLDAYGQSDLRTHGGRVWAYVYDTGRKEVDEIAQRAFLKYLDVNCLDPTVYPSALQMERDVVRIGAAHLRGDDNVAADFSVLL